MNMKNPRITLEDISKELGISQTTISRAISGKGRVSADTKERVFAYLEEHDLLSRFKKEKPLVEKHYNIGLMLPPDFTDIGNPFFVHCLLGVNEEAAKNHYDVVLSFSGEQGFDQLERQILEQKVDGIIISRAIGNSNVQKFLKKKNVPFVVIGSGNDPEVSYVDNPNKAACEELTELLLLKGIRRLGLLGGERNFYVNQDRLLGFVEAHEKAGIPVDRSIIYMEVKNYPKAAKVVKELLEQKIDGIVCMEDSICYMVMSCLRELGVQVPSELCVASFYDSEMLEYNQPSVTSLHFDARELGRKACLNLLRQLGTEPEEEVFSGDYQVILRESTKRR